MPGPRASRWPAVRGARRQNRADRARSSRSQQLRRRRLGRRRRRRRVHDVRAPLAARRHPAARPRHRRHRPHRTAAATHLDKRLPGHAAAAPRSARRGRRGGTRQRRRCARISVLRLDKREFAAAAVRGFDATAYRRPAQTRRRWCSRRPSASVPAYVDLSDPVEYIDQALAMACRTETVGRRRARSHLSNILAMECASRLPAGAKVQDRVPVLHRRLGAAARSTCSSRTRALASRACTRTAATRRR